MTDIYVRIFVEILFKVALWAIERIGTSSYAQDVIHNIEKRVERSGVRDALKAAVEAIPHAFQSRIAAGPRPVVDACANGLAGGAPLFSYLTISFAGYLFNTHLYAFVISKTGTPWLILNHAVGVAIFIVLTVNIANLAYSVGTMCAEGSKRVSIAATLFSVDLILLAYLMRPVATQTLAQDVALNMVFPAMIAVTLLLSISRRANAPRRDAYVESYLRRSHAWVIQLRDEREREFRKSFAEMREVPVKRFVYPRS